MNTLSFFSFKGGVGRTNLLLNVAYGLAQRGDFVVIADWDLHAPGFSLNPLFFRPDLEVQDEIDVRKGVLDFLDSALDPADQTQVEDPKHLAQPTRLGKEDRASGKFIDPLDRDRNGDLWMIPAGRFDPREDIHGYHDQLRRVQSRNLADWILRFNKAREKDAAEAKQDVGDPGQLLGFFRERVEAIEHPETGRKPDWLLIDARTGLTEIADLLLNTAFVDRMVLVSGFNDQNLAGIESTIRAVQKDARPYASLRSQLTLVFGPSPNGEEKLKQQRLKRIRDLIQDLARERDGESEPMPKIFTIPYHPRIALHEDLMLRSFPDSDLTPAFTQVIKELRGKANVRETLSRQEQALQTFLQTVKILPKTQQPTFPSIPFAKLPVWNWPDSSRDADRFIPPVAEADIPLLSGLARSLLLDNSQKQAILNKLNQLDEEQKSNLQQNFAGERSALTDLVGTQANEAILLAARRSTEWLDYWVEHDLVQREEAVKRVLNDHEGTFLGSLGKIGLFWVHFAHYLETHALWRQAEEAFHKAIALDPNFAVIWNDFGNLLSDYLHRYDEAEQAFLKAIELDSKFANPWNNLGYLLTQHLHRYDEAEQAFRKAIELDPKLVSPWNDLSHLLQDNLQRYDEAKQAFRKAIELDSKFATPWNSLGYLLTQYLHRYFSTPWNNLGYLLTQHLHRYDEAEQAFRKAIELNPKDATPWNNLGNLLSDHLHRYDEAKQAFRKAIELNPKDFIVYLNLAELGLVTDQVQLAKESLDKAKLTTQTNKDRITLALMRLGYALGYADTAAVREAHAKLTTLQSDDAPHLTWSFDDQALFIQRLQPSQRRLYQSWIDAFSKDETRRNDSRPEEAFAAWRAAAD